MRWLETESLYIVVGSNVGDTVKIYVLDLLTDTVIINGVTMTPITGYLNYYKYLFNPVVSGRKDYFAIAINQDDTQLPPRLITRGGYPNTLVDYARYTIDFELFGMTTFDLSQSTLTLGIDVMTSRGIRPTTAEITTAGTISILTKPKGQTGFSTKVNNATMTKQDGGVYYQRVFNSASGYAEGDTLLFVFKNVIVTIDGITYEVINNGTGLQVYSEIRETISTVIWNALTSAFLTAGSIGKLIVDFLNISVSSRASETAATSNKNTIIAAVATRAPASEYDAILNQLDDQVKRLLGLNYENAVLEDVQYITYQGKKLLTDARKKTYPTASDAENDTNMTDEYKIEVTYNDDEMTKYIETRL